MPVTCGTAETARAFVCFLEVSKHMCARSDLLAHAGGALWWCVLSVHVFSIGAGPHSTAYLHYAEFCLLEFPYTPTLVAPKSACRDFLDYFWVCIVAQHAQLVA